MRAPVVEAAGLRCAYGDFDAVRGVDLRAEPGEVLAVLGVNGAGKTTLLECLEGLRPPSAGQVRVFGRDPFRDRRGTRPRMGVMLQEGGFAGELTVRETVRLWSRLSTGARPVPEALDLMDLQHRADVAVAQLSGGERRRLDVAIASLKRPELLFLDEPTTGLDPESRAAAWRVVERLRADGATVVLTTHYLEEAERLADRVLVLQAGRIAVQGSVQEVLARERAHIEFAPPPGVTVAELPALAGTVEVDAHRVLVSTDALQTDLMALLHWADRRGIALGALRAGQATLADLFFGVVEAARDHGADAADGQDIGVDR